MAMVRMEQNERREQGSTPQNALSRVDRLPALPVRDELTVQQCQIESRIMLSSAIAGRWRWLGATGR
jgi:hypothetical protein